MIFNLIGGGGSSFGKIVTWAGGTDQEIADMVSAADAGIINLSDYWAVGDERTVHLSAMAQTVSGLSETHAAQDIVLVLMNSGGKTLTAGGTCNFIVGQKNVLGFGNNVYETGMMNSSASNAGGWEACPRRIWCNSIYKNAFPAALLPIFKQFKNVTADGSSSTTATSDDYFALPSEKEVFGNTNFANGTAETANSQFKYYQTASNRIKYHGSGSADTEGWWERSPNSGDSSIFCRVDTDGNANIGDANYTNGIAPFGCI